MVWHFALNITDDRHLSQIPRQTIPFFAIHFLLGSACVNAIHSNCSITNDVLFGSYGESLGKYYCISYVDVWISEFFHA